MPISIYDLISQNLYTIITVAGSLIIIIYLWARFGKKERGRYNR